MRNLTRQFDNQNQNETARPVHLTPFQMRTRETWTAFVNVEAELRDLMDRTKTEHVSEDLAARCADILSLAFTHPSFELGFNGEKYDLILSPEGDRVRLFQLAYFAECAPESIKEHWNIIVGRPASDNYILRMHDLEVTAADVQTWVERCGEKDLILSLYCEKLLPLLREHEGQAYSLIYILADQVLGEIACMRYIANIHLLPSPIAGDSFPLADLPAFIKTGIDPEGWSASANAQAACESWSGYRGDPSTAENWPLRADVIAGMTCCLPLINAYFNQDNYYVDMLQQDGADPGFLYWLLEGIDKDEVLPLRDRIEEAIVQKAGTDAVTFIGGATGVVYGYLDFIAWDFPSVMDAAKKALNDTPVRLAGFHLFCMDTTGVELKRI